MISKRVYCVVKEIEKEGEREGRSGRRQSQFHTKKRVKSTECVINGYVVLWRADIVGKEDGYKDDKSTN